MTSVLYRRSGSADKTAGTVARSACLRSACPVAAGTVRLFRGGAFPGCACSSWRGRGASSPWPRPRIPRRSGSSRPPSGARKVSERRPTKTASSSGTWTSSGGGVASPRRSTRPSKSRWPHSTWCGSRAPSGSRWPGDPNDLRSSPRTRSSGPASAPPRESPPTQESTTPTSTRAASPPTAWPSPRTARPFIWLPPAAGSGRPAPRTSSTPMPPGPGRP